ncbi:MAG: J domain-containing protein [Candidatus Kaiserbacteria bacterium]|nr:J domain-containing protein [Candidatus Kaiserbacteria bacterium]MCB9816529.1 J domain-containing protein [Candidatus Nomurabacteria bacterium]
MATKRKTPALTVLGISPALANKLPTEAVVMVAKSIYRTLAGRYHPDKNQGAAPPASIDLTALQEAARAVEADPQKCIAEVSAKARTTKQEKEMVGLEAVVEQQTAEIESLRESLLLQWQRSAAASLGVRFGELLTKQSGKDTYDVQNLNGLGIIVRTPNTTEEYREYLLDKGHWFTRPLVKKSFGVKSPLPPGIRKELVIPASGSDGARGFYYDQADAYDRVESFVIIGSYTVHDLREAQEKAQKETADESAKQIGVLSMGEKLSTVAASSSELDSVMSAVLEPNVASGRVVIFAELGAANRIRFKTLGTVVSVRVFDASQRR